MNWIVELTCTSNSGIYTAVSDFFSGAPWDGGLVPGAGGFDSTRYNQLSKMHARRLSGSGAAVNLLAHHVFFILAPLIVACSFPLTVVEDFHSAVTPTGSVDHLHVFCKQCWVSSGICPVQTFISYSNSCQFLKKEKISWASERETCHLNSVVYNIPHQVQKLVLMLKVISTTWPKWCQCSSQPIATCLQYFLWPQWEMILNLHFGQHRIQICGSLTLTAEIKKRTSVLRS